MYLFISLNWLGTIVPEQIFEAQPERMDALGCGAAHTH
jgi:hypothetical protein